jgi:site-specific recombinase XerD
MVNMTLSFIITEVMKALTGFGLAAGSIRLYRKHFDKMQAYFDQNKNEYYSERMLDNYWCSLVSHTKPYAAKYLIGLRRTIDLVKDFYTNGIIIWSHRKRKRRYNPCDFYQTIITKSICWLQLAGPTLVWYDTVVRKFCCKLENHNILDFSHVSSSIVSGIISEFGVENMRSMGSVVSSLKNFFTFLNKEGLCNIDICSSLFVSYKRVERIPAFSTEEINALLHACDRTTLIGKRNYSIMLLAVTCGLRRSDLVGLELRDIDWHRYELRITQSKTKKAILLPLLGEVGNAIADYILSSRPKDSGYENMCLTSRAPLRPLGPVALNDILTRLCVSASVQKIAGRDFHSLRRSAGTRMANSGVPVTTIAQVLGHSRFCSADRYISADPHMVSCSLDFTGILPASEAYR